MKIKLLSVIALSLMFFLSGNSNAYILCSIYEEPCVDDPSLSPEIADMTKSCLLDNSAASCADLATNYFGQGDKKIKENESYALYYAKKANEITSDYNYVLAFIQTYAVDEKLRDYNSALSIFKESCDHKKRGTQCFQAALISHNVFKDYKLALEYAEKGCELKNGESCYTLANEYSSGRIVKKNIGKAKELYKKACDLEVKEACGK